MAKSSAIRKFEWGQEQLDALCREAAAYENGKAYELRIERELRSPEEVFYSCFAFQRKAIPDHWPMAIGDVVHNIRSSLDHLVYTAAKGKGRTQFPIFQDHCEFQVKAGKDIATIPKAIRTLIEEVQPFKTVIARPHTDALAVLADLSNHDKHRNITAVVSYVEIPWLVADGNIELVRAAQGKPLSPDKETEVVAFIVRGPEADKMKVKPDFSYQVRIERVRKNMRTTDIVPLVGTLENVARRVRYIIDLIEGRQPLSVWLAPAI